MKKLQRISNTIANTSVAVCNILIMDGYISDNVKTDLSTYGLVNV